MNSIRKLAATALLTLFTASAFALDDAANVPEGPSIAPLPAGVALRAATVRVAVVPDHRDWTYTLGESVQFTVSVTADNEPIDNVTVTYTVGPDMYPGEKKTVAMPLTGLAIDAGTMKEPGFLRCIVTADVAGHRYRGLATAAFAPEQIKPRRSSRRTSTPSGTRAKADLAKVPIEARMTLLPDCLHVDGRCLPRELPHGGRRRGPVSAPDLRNPLRAEGAGPLSRDSQGARSGGKALFRRPRRSPQRARSCSRSASMAFPVNLAKEVYDELGAGALSGYWLFNFDDQEHYYYHRIYLGCIRANDFLTSRPDWDGKNLLVMGASQGGQLTIVTAALDHRVTGLSATHPAFCDVSRRAQRPCRRLAPSVQGGGRRAPSAQATPAKIATAPTTTRVNFARSASRFPDITTGATTTRPARRPRPIAAYNVITAPKTLGVTLELGHTYTVEQYDAISGWITNFLGLK